MAQTKEQKAASNKRYKTKHKGENKYAEYNKVYKKQYQLDNKEKTHRDHRKYSCKQFGITVEDYNEMFEKQEGKCAICGKHQTELKKALAIDHSHKTGKVRGLLCGNCNIGIGNLQDDPYVITRALEYLQDAA